MQGSATWYMIGMTEDNKVKVLLDNEDIIENKKGYIAHITQIYPPLPGWEDKISNQMKDAATQHELLSILIECKASDIVLKLEEVAGLMLSTANQNHASYASYLELCYLNFVGEIGNAICNKRKVDLNYCTKQLTSILLYCKREVWRNIFTKVASQFPSEHITIMLKALPSEYQILGMTSKVTTLCGILDKSKSLIKNVITCHARNGNRNVVEMMLLQYKTAGHDYQNLPFSKMLTDAVYSGSMATLRIILMHNNKAPNKEENSKTAFEYARTSNKVAQMSEIFYTAFFYKYEFKPDIEQTLTDNIKKYFGKHPTAYPKAQECIEYLDNIKQIKLNEASADTLVQRPHHEVDWT